MATGHVVQVIGPVVDIEFPPGELPSIYNAVKISNRQMGIGIRPSQAELMNELVLEVQTELGNNQVRCLALGVTDGLERGAEAVDTGSSIQIPVGKETLGRVFNVLG